MILSSLSDNLCDLKIIILLSNSAIPLYYNSIDSYCILFSSINMLFLGENNIGDYGLYYLAQALKIN